MTHLIINADARRIPLADRSVHCVVTSPPYWSLRDYKVSGQIGLEKTPDEYVAEMVAVFREVRRVLRDDGTLWLNLGDSYSQGTKGAACGAEEKQRARRFGLRPSENGGSGISAGNLIGIPWRVALALQADGWILRAEIIWHKRSPMPESVKTRPTRSHEHVFLLAKKPKYFYDWFAVTEKAKSGHASGNGFTGRQGGAEHHVKAGGTGTQSQWNSDRRNLRTVWTLSSEAFSGAHFATFPRNLVLPCIKAGTSEKGCCPKCGAQWVRDVAKERVATRPGTKSGTAGHSPEEFGNRDPQRHVTRYVTTGWEPGCQCGTTETVPATVFDPFGGAGTVPLVAESLGRRGVCTELSPVYCQMASERIQRPYKPIDREPVKVDDLPLFRRA